jgi:hypothetical protein
MEVDLPKELDEKIAEISVLLDMDEEEIVNRAVILYIDNIEKFLELKKELKQWDALSDEAFENFERDL